MNRPNVREPEKILVGDEDLFVRKGSARIGPVIVARADEHGVEVHHNEMAKLHI